MIQMVQKFAVLWSTATGYRWNI